MPSYLRVICSDEQWSDDINHKSQSHASLLLIGRVARHQLAQDAPKERVWEVLWHDRGVEGQSVEGQSVHWQLAELNVARLRAPLEDPATRDFVEALDAINALAESSPGFVWRLQTDDGNATSIQAFDDELVITNLSVWESVEALSDYVYRSGHVSFLRRKREWFERYGSAHLVLWWVPSGHRPTVSEALARLDIVHSGDPTADAFSFSTPFPPPTNDVR